MMENNAYIDEAKAMKIYNMMMDEIPNPLEIMAVAALGVGATFGNDDEMMDFLVEFLRKTAKEAAKVSEK